MTMVLSQEQSVKIGPNGSIIVDHGWGVCFYVESLTTSYNLNRTKFPFHVLLVVFGSCFVLYLNTHKIEFKIMLRIYFLQFSYLTVASHAWMNVFPNILKYQQISFKYFSFEIFKFKKRISLWIFLQLCKYQIYTTLFLLYLNQTSVDMFFLEERHYLIF